MYNFDTQPDDLSEDEQPVNFVDAIIEKDLQAEAQDPTRNGLLPKLENIKILEDGMEADHLTLSVSKLRTSMRQPGRKSHNQHILEFK